MVDFDKIRNRQATRKHGYYQRPAYVITEEELARLEESYKGTGFHFATIKPFGSRQTLRIGGKVDDGT